MFDCIANSLENQLPADAYDHLVRTLRLTLPPPPDDTPEALRRRDHAAIARVAALAPADAAEAELAAQFVAASEQWKDCLRLAQAPETSLEWAMKCRAQAASMMRQANAALRLLLRLQQPRGKLDNAAADRRAWAEHTATRLMAEALAAIPAQPTVAPPREPERNQVAKPPPSPPRAGLRERPGSAAAETPGGGRAADPELIAAAERYAALYPERAAQIRRTGKLPCDVRYFDPPEAALASALIAGRTRPLVALDAAQPRAA